MSTSGFFFLNVDNTASSVWKIPRIPTRCPHSSVCKSIESWSRPASRRALCCLLVFLLGIFLIVSFTNIHGRRLEPSMLLHLLLALPNCHQSHVPIDNWQFVRSLEWAQALRCCGTTRSGHLRLLFMLASRISISNARVLFMLIM